MRSFLSVFLLAAALAAGGCSKVAETPRAQAAQGASAAPSTSQAAAGAPMQSLPDFAAIAEANKGAVVNITSTISAKPQAQARPPFSGQGPGAEEDEDNPLNEFLRRFGLEGGVADCASDLHEFASHLSWPFRSPMDATSAKQRVVQGT